MNQIKRHTLNSRYGQTVLVLQGGGALGAYQAGVYETMAAAAILPDCFAGLSILVSHGWVMN